ncbi:MAG: efflux RND transporter periplasmic adaptor subunit [Sedimentisphaerales bacterium]|nr:efflux RND transporter periplasmic adaptor subunit [Sedimentisphaerales bacterium]
MTQNKSTGKNSNVLSRLCFVLICFIITGAGGFWIYKSQQSQAVETTDSQAQNARVPVVISNPVRRTFEQVIAAQGNVEAKNAALVSPRIPGTIEEFFVDEGNSVIAGETKLFHTDALKLQQSVTIREHDLAVAICAGKQANASLEKVTADFEKAELDFKRFERLLEQNATTQDVFEKQQSEYKQLAASVKVSQAQVELAAEHVRQAEAALAIARKDLTDTTVIAPIKGVVSMRMAEPGETGSPGVPVLRIEDPNIIEISAFLPAAIYPAVITGQTIMRVTVSGVELGNQTVSYKSPTIQSKLRTFEVKCLIENPPAGVAPGAMAEIKVILASREGLGVPVVSVQQRSNQSVVFITEGDIAHMRVVRTGFENDGWVEIVDGKITESAQVVSMGQNMLNEGTTVSILKESD